MPAVSNTSPLLNLAIINHLHLLPDQFGEVFIPPAVAAELQADRDLLGSAQLQAALKAGWLRVVALEQHSLATVLREQLDHGEAEAIALALQLPPLPVLIDEREGRALAKALGLRVTGLLGVLLRARATGEVAEVAPLLDSLEHVAGFRIASPLRHDVLAAAGEAVAGEGLSG